MRRLPARGAAAAAEPTLQEARSLVGRGNYPSGLAAAERASTQLAPAAASMMKAIASRQRRRRKPTGWHLSSFARLRSGQVRRFCTAADYQNSSGTTIDTIATMTTNTAGPNTIPTVFRR